jgi:hypothetical protein
MEETSWKAISRQESLTTFISIGMQLAMKMEGSSEAFYIKNLL